METGRSDSKNARPGRSLEKLTEYYLKDRFHNFNMKADIRINTSSESKDRRLELRDKSTYAFITARIRLEKREVLPPWFFARCLHFSGNGCSRQVK